MPEEIRFSCPCPNLGCPNPNKMRDWTHSDPCGGTLYLDKYGMISCKSCNDKYHIFDSRFKCSDERNYGETNMTKIYSAIAAVGQMDNGDPEMTAFCDELLDELTIERTRRKKLGQI